MTRFYKHWTMKELRFLKDNYNKMSLKEMAQKLERSYNSIVGRAHMLGIRKDVPQYAVYKNGEVLATGTIDEVAEQLSISRKTVTLYATPSHKKRLKESGVNGRYAIRLGEEEPCEYIKKPKEYAMYKGDDYVTSGTIEEIAEKHGAKQSTIRYYLTPTYKKKLEKRNSRNAIKLIEMEDDDE